MVRAAALVLVCCSLVLGAAPPATAHARVVGVVPADGATVDVPPPEVVLTFDSKPVTAEADPVVVYGPTGERVDAGQVAVDEAGTRLSVPLTAGPLPAGTYEVVHRVVSADTHLIAGRSSFHSRGSVPQVAAGHLEARPAAVQPVAARPVARHTLQRGTESCPDCRGWPEAIAGAVAVTIVALGVGRRWAEARRTARHLPR